MLAGTSVGSAAGLAAVPIAAALVGTPGLQAALLCTAVATVTTHALSYFLFSTAGAAFPESFEHTDGGRYRGEWKGMLKDGHGVYTYPSGARYEGEWLNGVKTGRGVYHFPKGGLYEGEWRGGTMSGVGVRTFASGKVQSGVWEGGKLAQPMEEWQCALAVEGANEAAEVAKRVVVGGTAPADALKALASQPAAWAFVAAGVMVAAQASLTPTVQLVTEKLAAAHAPLALLALGMTADLEPAASHQVSRKTITPSPCTEAGYDASLAMFDPFSLVLHARLLFIFCFFLPDDANLLARARGGQPSRPSRLCPEDAPVLTTPHSILTPPFITPSWVRKGGAEGARDGWPSSMTHYYYEI